MIRRSLRALAAFAALALPAAALAQSSPSAFTSAERYDDMNRVVGTIAPDPNAGDPINYIATRTTYDIDGRVTRVEKGRLTSWQSDSVLPSAWPTWNPSTNTGFQIFSQVDTDYDGLDRKIKETVSSGGTDYGVTQYSYDAVGRLDCTAVRMNPSVFGSLPSSACTASTTGSNGPDRITRNVYDDAGQLLRVQKAYGTSLQQDYVTYTYSANGKVLTVKDANGNKAGYTYDGLDRQTQWNFPDKVTIGTISTTDYEAYTYDANGNRLTLRKRDASVIGYTYDNLNRVTVKDIPGGTSADVYYAYDARGQQLYARFASTSGSNTIDNVWDGFGRLTSQTTSMSGTSRTVSYAYDADGNRTLITHPDGNYFAYGYDGLDRLRTLNENTTFLLEHVYYPTGQLYYIGRITGSNTGYYYDGVDRLTLLANDPSGTSSDINYSLTYSPASQIATRTLSNPTAYAYSGYASVSRSYTANGLNQYSAVGGASPTYDANGNLTGDGTYTYSYDVENRLTGKSGGLALTYDPLGRLWQTAGGSSGTTQFLYDGDQLIAEYDNTGAVVARYAQGAGPDSPLVMYAGPSVNSTTRRYLYADERGSITTIADGSSAVLTINSYDEYGNPASGNVGRFQYTGQAWLADLGMYYYKARIYNPVLGRFMQTDPIGYADQNNLYAYVGNDPVNKDDPTGENTGSYLEQHDGGCGQASPCSSIPGDSAVGNQSKDNRRASPASGQATTDGSGEEDGWYVGLNGLLQRGPRPNMFIDGDTLTNRQDARDLSDVMSGKRSVTELTERRGARGDGAFTGAMLVDGAAAIPAARAALSMGVKGLRSFVRVEGAGKAAKYGTGRMGQIRFGGGRLILRLDRPPRTGGYYHFNIESQSLGFNLHIPLNPLRWFGW